MKPSPALVALAGALRDLPAEHLARLPAAVDAFAMLQAAYPAWKGDDETRKLYCRYLCAHPPSAMALAIRAWIENPASEWPPTPGKLLALLRSYTPWPETERLLAEVATLRRARGDDSILASTDRDLLTATARLQIEQERDRGAPHRPLLPPDHPDRLRIAGLLSARPAE